MDKPYPRRVVVLGSTGSIGKNAVIELLEHKDQFKTVGLVARNSTDLLAQQAAQLQADTIITTDEEKLDALKSAAPNGCKAEAGLDAMMRLVTRPDVDVVLCAILGVTGIRPVLAALALGKHVALASKEVLCMAGELVMDAAAKSPGGGIVPVDSEHSGLFQCLQGRRPDEISKLWITASGGPFRNYTSEQLKTVSVSDALKHPTWSMGAKITIDSASLMNKALELIEAHYLFNMPEAKLGAVIHPQSKVHALVELTDGTFISQLSAPDMRMAIRYGMTYPQRMPGSSAKMDMLSPFSLEFQPIDAERFPAIRLAKAAIQAGGTFPAVLNAANDIAVSRFMRGDISFTDIWRIVEKTISAFNVAPQQSLEQLENIDKEARLYAANV